MAGLFNRHSTLKMALAISLCINAAGLAAAELDPKAIAIQLPDQIKWVANPSGTGACRKFCYALR